MACSTPHRWRWIRRSLLFFYTAALALPPGMARAQQGTSHAGAAARHPIVIAGGVHPGPAVATPPARAGVPLAIPRTGSGARWPTWPANASRFASGPRVMRGVQPGVVFLPQSSFRPVFEARSFFEPFFFSALFPGSFGYPGSVSQFGGMPLGFGLWPACDSAGTPGMFWTVGPCFGVGTYSEELAPGFPSEYLLGTGPPVYAPPLIFIEAAPATGPAAEQNPSAPSPAPTMLLYMTDGKTIAAADWWVAHGRLQYITDSGAKGVMDLSQLDLEQTIKQNQTRGLEFHLRFTPPSERYAPSERP